MGRAGRLGVQVRPNRLGPHRRRLRARRLLMFSPSHAQTLGVQCQRSRPAPDRICALRRGTQVRCRLRFERAGAPLRSSLRLAALPPRAVGSVLLCLRVGSQSLSSSLRPVNLNGKAFKSARRSGRADGHRDFVVPATSMFTHPGWYHVHGPRTRSASLRRQLVPVNDDDSCATTRAPSRSKLSVSLPFCPRKSQKSTAALQPAARDTGRLCDPPQREMPAATCTGLRLFHDRD